MGRLLFLVLVFSFIVPKINAQSVIDSLESLLLKANDTPKVDVLNNLSFQYYYKSKIKSDSFAVLAINEALKLQYARGLAFGYVNYAYTTSKLRTKVEAIALFNKAYSLAFKNGNERIMAQAKNGVGSTYLNLALYDSAKNQYKLAYQAFCQLKDTAGMSGALNNLGLVNKNLGNYDEALKYYHEAFDLNKQIGNTRKQIRNLINIGLTYIDLQEESNAEKYFVEALDLLEGTTFEKYKADAYNGLAMVAKKTNNFELCENYYFKAKQHATKANDRLGLAVILHNLSDLHSSLNKNDLALAEAKESLKLKKAINNPKSIVFSLSLISSIYAKMGNGKLALEYARKNLKLAQNLKLKERENIALNNMAIAYSLLGDYRNAYKYKIQFISLKDSLFKEAKAEQIARMEIEFQTERKEQEIETQSIKLESQFTQIQTQKNINTLYLIGGSVLLILLTVVFLQYKNQRSLINQLTSQNAIIFKQNSEKETLLKEIHHRVKNNLQIISSLLNLQSRHLDDGLAKEAVKESRSRIKSMSLIHQRLYTDNNMATIDMPVYLKELTDFLFATFKPNAGIQKQINSEELKFDVDIAVPLGLIINELISNALKYAFEKNDAGDITVNLSTLSKNTYQLIIADNGKGIDAENNKFDSMGMRLVDTLIEQIGAKIEVSIEKGTAYTISFSSQQA